MIKPRTLAIVSLLLVAVVTSCNKENSIKVGQTWKYTYGIDNPYENAHIHYNKVIDVTGDYVLYIKDGKDTVNEKKYWFVVNSECIDNCH